ncbi:TonB-dependent receptor [uncultured Flavobacterium sp.]|uniref:TonB-dependent receptor n=1 Tax=uncultured Flavobacterium sp. TaxID=165435 RepID=UPI0025F495B3|nr:TonB-dependent receptor [uncultured Flavobacterium sp.]
MKNWLLFNTILLLLFTKSIYAQQEISFPEETLESRIIRIERLSNISIAFDHKQTAAVKVPAYSSKNQTWEKALETSLSGTSFMLKKSGNSYAVIPKSATGNKKIGAIKGKIVDEFGLPVPGSNIIVQGTALGVQTDSNGDFSLSLEEGISNLEISYISYQTQRITGVRVKAGEVTDLNIVLKPDALGLDEVVINVSYNDASTQGLLMQQKRAAQMSDGISAEQIAKTPDSDVGATLKRITGITTIDNKYVVVRSMGERWNTAAMDGINLPSTEAYNQNFSFDIIPTAMVESVVVSKTATPDMNASFAGGYVEVRTKDIPEKDFFSFTWGSSYNSQSTFNDFLSRQKGKNDYFGYDDGTRDFPKGLIPTSLDNPLFYEQSKRFTNDNFTTYNSKADPGSSFQLALGRSFKMKNNNKWGFAAAATLRNEQTKLDIEHTGRGNWLDTAGLINNWQEQGVAPVKFFNFQNKGASYTYNSTLAGMFNAGLQLGDHRVSFRNSYTHLYDNTLTRVTGWNEYTGGSGDPAGAEKAYDYFYNGIKPSDNPADIASLDRPYTDNVNYPVYQTLLQNKLEGKHKLGGTELDWYAARTSVASDTKDLTQHVTLYNFIGNEILEYHQIYNSGNNFTRAYIESRETDYNFGASFKWNVDIGDFKSSIKTGYGGTLKSNTNQQEKFFLRVDENRADVPPNERNMLFINGPLSDWFDGSKYEVGGIGWQTIPLYKDSKYEGEVKQHAPYIMFDNRWKSKLRLVWGIRAEYFKYTLLSQQLDPADSRNLLKESIDDKPWQFMPSVNFTYSPLGSMNLRLAYSKTVIRPQFNERTGLPYIDPVANAMIYNTSMISSIINNYDFKFEWFPGLGEILSAGVYYKDIDHPIEREGYISNEGNLYLYNGNSKNATLTGLEVEARKNLGFIYNSTFFNNLFISGNFTYNETKVTAFKNRYDTSETGNTYRVERPLYGQTPYAYNLGLMYEGDRLGASFLYNAKGDQYITVGYSYNAEEIQRPYAVADMQLAYKFLKNKNLEIKFNAKNLFDRVKEYYNNNNSYSVSQGVGSDFETQRESLGLLPGATSKYDSDIDKIIFRARTGRTFGLSINLTF